MLSGIDADMQEQRNTAPANMQQEEEQVQTVFFNCLALHYKSPDSGDCQSDDKRAHP